MACKYSHYTCHIGPQTHIIATLVEKVIYFVCKNSHSKTIRIIKIS